VREFASLSAHSDQDRRTVRTTVDAIAHPGKLQQYRPGRQRQALAQLHALASSASWSELVDNARRLLSMPGVSNESSLERGLKRLLDTPALGRLQHLEALESDEQVRQYQSLWDRHGPRSGSPAAAAQGSVA